VKRLADAGFLSADGGSPPAGLSDPKGMAAAQGLRYITLGDLMAEHMPDQD